jgi:hypothetical protein
VIGRAALAASALVVGLGIWSTGLGGPYVFDDYATPISDPASQSLSAWGQYLPVTLRPATKLTYALEATLGLSDAPDARRVVSILLHGVSAGLLFLLISRLVPGVAPIGAAALAAIWFVHPVHADGVLLVSGRTTIMSNALVIAALLALDRSRPWICALCYGLACLSRETAFAALLPLGVLAVTRQHGQWRAVWRDVAPLLAAAVLVIGWMLTTPRYMQLAEYSMLGRPFWSSLIRQVGAVPIGLGLLFDTSALSIDYGIALPTRVAQPLFVLGLLLYLATGAGIVLLWRRRPAVAVGLALWLAALLPTQSVVPKLDALANRPLSLALAGLLVAVAPWVRASFGSVRDGFGSWRQWRDRAGWRAIAEVSVAILLFGALAVATSRRGLLFQSPIDLWKDAAAKSTVNERPHVQYALLLRQEGRHREAIEELSIAARIDPFSSQIATMLRVFRSQETSR